MKTILARGKTLFGKAALATVALGGFIAFFGVSTASAQTYCYERPRFHAVVVAPGFYGYYGPRPAYVYRRPVYGPVYRPYYRRHVEYRHWERREHEGRYR